MLNEQKLISLISNEFLELIIMPTEQCNFRCVYCYEDFSIGKMKANTVQAIKNLLIKRMPSLSALKISWFGGEPLAAKNIVYDISEFIQQSCSVYPKLQYSSGMTTNGFALNNDVLQRLVFLGVKHFQISLDGTETRHDTTRIRANGGSTFQKIWQNLLSAQKSNLDFSIMIRIHITPENLTDIYKLTELIKLSFRGDKRFSVFFKAIENLGGPKSGKFKTIHHKDKAEILRELYEYLGDDLKGKKLNDNGQYVCYAAQTNSFVIRANGKIGKCTVAFNDERNNLGQLSDDGEISIDMDKLWLWTRGIKSQNASELSCPMYQLPTLNRQLETIAITAEFQK